MTQDLETLLIVELNYEEQATWIFACSVSERSRVPVSLARECEPNKVGFCCLEPREVVFLAYCPNDETFYSTIVAINSRLQ